MGKTGVMQLTPLTGKEREQLGDAIRAIYPTREVYFLAGKIGGMEFLQGVNPGQSPKDMYWNWEGRVFDADLGECSANGLKGWKLVSGSLHCVDVDCLPCEVEDSGCLGVAFRAEFANVNYGQE